MDLSAPETDCCPRFEPGPWQEKTFELDHLMFAKAYTKSIGYIPINMNKVMTQSMKYIDSIKAQPVDRFLILSKDLSPWKCEHNFQVAKEVPGMEMDTISGTFFTKVYDGDFKELPKWIKDIEASVKQQGKEMKEIYYYYTTCPKCAKYYNANYVVLFAKV